VRLGDGLRVHVVLPPLAVSGTALSIRVPRAQSMSLVDLDRRGFFPAGALETVIGCVERRANVLVSGAGGAGRTTFLAALLSEAPGCDRIVTIEDVAELRPRHPHVVALETRQPNLEGAGGVDLSRLVREALRMRPDRLVIGEVRGREIRDQLSALNTGHDGGAGTVHANGLDDVPARLEALGALAGLGVDALARQAVSAIDAVFHLERRGGHRRLVEIGHLAVTLVGRAHRAGVARRREGGEQPRPQPLERQRTRWTELQPERKWTHGCSQDEREQGHEQTTAELMRG
jgi:pilus assembly protein CpaF